MINYRIGERGVLQSPPPPAKKEHHPRCSFSVTHVMLLSLRFFRNIYPLSWLGISHTLVIHHLPSIVLDNKHINHDFMQKKIIVVQNTRGKIQNLAQYLSV
jgi:hypothetical protein